MGLYGAILIERQIFNKNQSYDLDRTRNFEKCHSNQQTRSGQQCVFHWSLFHHSPKFPSAFAVRYSQPSTTFSNCSDFWFQYEYPGQCRLHVRVIYLHQYVADLLQISKNASYHGMMPVCIGQKKEYENTIRSKPYAHQGWAKKYNFWKIVSIFRNHLQTLGGNTYLCVHLHVRFYSNTNSHSIRELSR